MGDGETKEISITFETLFELLRLEKNRDELQKLSNSFYSDVLNYFKEKYEILKKKEQESDIFTAEETRKLRLQIDNVKRIFKDIYERREKKIINLAINKSRTNSDIINTDLLLKEEKEFHDLILENLNAYRQGILYNLINLKPHEIKKPETKETREKEGAKTTKLVRFLSPIPKFFGPELEIYGPFIQEDMATLPNKVADILVTKGRAEEIEAD